MLVVVADGGDGSPVSLLANLGPIAVKAVANLVAAEAVNNASAGGGLLAGSHGVMMAVTQHKAGAQRSSSNGGTPSGTPLASAAGAAASAVEQDSGRVSPRGSAPNSPRTGAPTSPRGLLAGGPIRGSSMGAAGLSSSLGPSNGSRKLSSSLSAASTGSPRLSAAAAAMAAVLHRRTVSGAGSSMGGAAANAPPGAAAAAAALSSTMGSDDGSSDDGDAAHDRFVAWMSSHEIQGSLDSDNMSDYFPEQLPEWDESAVDAAGGTGTAGAGTGVQTPTRPATPDMSAGTAAGVLPQQQQLALAGAPEQQGQLSARGKLQATDLPAGLTGRGVGVADAPGSSISAAVSAQSSLPPIRTTPATNSAAGPGKAGSAGLGGLAGLTAVPRVVLPGRAMMPAGINDTVVPVFDGEPTSIAAYFLSSRAYQQQLNAAMRLILHEESKRVAEEASRLQQEAKRATAAAAASTAAALRQQIQQGNGADSSGSAVNSTLPLPVPTQHSRTRSQDAGAAAVLAAAAAVEAEGGSSSTGPLESAAAGDGSSIPTAGGSSNGSVSQQQGSPKHMRTNSTGSSSGSTTAAWRVKLRQQQAAASRSQGSQKQVQPDWLALLLSPEPLHVKHAFEDESPGMPWLRARFGVTAYFAPQFAELRRRCIVGGEAAYITSLCRCRKWASRGGKSNAYFAKTRDDRFIIKSLSKPEKVSLMWSCLVQHTNLRFLWCAAALCVHCMCGGARPAGSCRMREYVSSHIVVL